MSVRDDFLPEFDSATGVSLSNAMIDRFELEMGDFALIGDEDDICYVLNHLSHHAIHSAQGEAVRLFNDGNLRNLRSKTDIRFSEGGSGWGQFRAKPMIAGGIKRAGFRPQNFRQPRFQGERHRISIKAWLNLTRFVQGQRYIGPGRARNPIINGEPSLVIHPRPRWFAKETPLLPADNLLIGSVYPFGFAIRHGAANLAQVYLSTVERELEDLLVGQMANRSVETRIARYYSLQALEVYWEFSSPNPIGLVESLSTFLHRLSAHIRTTTEDLRNIEEEVYSQSKCVTIWLTTDVRLRVYAKTTHRIRFEIEFSASAISKICGTTTRTRSEVVAKIERLLVQAERDMNWVFGELRREVPDGTRQETVVGLISKIARTLMDDAKSEMAVASLRTYGRIAPERNQPLLEIAHSLRDAGILKTLRNKSIYVPTASFEHAVSTLVHIGQ